MTQTSLPADERIDRLIGGLQELAGKLTDSGVYEYGISSASVYATIVREGIETIERMRRTLENIAEHDPNMHARRIACEALSGA